MGVITPDRFNPIKAYCNVRLQQGVPLVDADVNELDDIRKFEVRAFLKWFVGNGVPDGNDGFHILPSGALADDFQISAGTQATGAAPSTPSIAANEFVLQTFGRCIVDGLDVIIQTSVNYKAQPLFHTQAGAAALATAYGVPVIADTPTAAGPFLVYLDIWERSVNATDPSPVGDSSLVVPPLGTESCARIKREWVVRTRTTLTVPASGDTDFLANHLYYGLATINRRLLGSTAQPILPTDITDLREQRLLTPPSTLIPDVLGMSASAYRQGQNRPAISLRDALNALLRGEIPATPDTAITTDANNDLMSYAFTFDKAGGVTAVWASNRNLSTNQAFAARWDPTAPGAGFTGLTMITNPASVHLVPSSATLPNGDLIVTYSNSPTTPANVEFKHAASLAAMTPTTPTPVAVVSNPAAAQRQPFVVATGTAAAGGTVVFFWHETPTASPANTRWVYQRRLYTPAWDEATATFTDAAGLPVSASPASAAPPTTAGDFHAASDGAGNVWAAYRSGAAAAASSIQVAQLTVATNAVTSLPVLHVGATTTDLAPFVIADASSSVVWVFWQSDGGIYSQQYQSGAGTAIGAPALVPDTSTGTHANPSAVRDATGAVWLFWESDRGGTGTRIWFNRRGAQTGWGSARQITGSALSDSQPFAAISPAGALWLFWRRAIALGNSDLFFKQIVTAI